MKYLKLALFLLSISLLYSCQKKQVVGKFEIRTTLVDSVVDNERPPSLHWLVDIQDEKGIEEVKIQFSNTSNQLEFPGIFKNTWSKEGQVDFDAHSIPDSWTITVIVRNQAGTISEQYSTVDLP